MATASLPTMPMTAATITQTRWSTSLGMPQAVDRLPRGHHAREGDHQDDEDAGDVLGPAVAVGEPAVGRPAAEAERQPQRQGGQRIGDVVQAVAQEGHGPTGPGDDELEHGGRRQPDQGDLEGPDALPAVLEGAVDDDAAVAVPRTAVTVTVAVVVVAVLGSVVLVRGTILASTRSELCSSTSTAPWPAPCRGATPTSRSSPATAWPSTSSDGGGTSSVRPTTATSTRSTPSAGMPTWPGSASGCAVGPAACGVGEDDLDALVADLHTASKTYTLKAYDEVPDVLAELRRRGLIVAICSNWDWDIDRAVAGAGLEGRPTWW